MAVFTDYRFFDENSKIKVADDLVSQNQQAKITLMKIALNGATTMRADLSTDILAASAAGYDLLEIWSAKL